MLKTVLLRTLSEVGSSKVFIIVDYHTAYDEKDGINPIDVLEKDLKKKFPNLKTCRTRKKMFEYYKPHMETQDIVPHAIKMFLEDNDSSVSTALNQRLIRLTDNDEIDVKIKRIDKKQK